MLDQGIFEDFFGSEEAFLVWSTLAFLILLYSLLRLHYGTAKREWRLFLLSSPIVATIQHSAALLCATHDRGCSLARTLDTSDIGTLAPLWWTFSVQPTDDKRLLLEAWLLMIVVGGGFLLGIADVLRIVWLATRTRSLGCRVLLWAPAAGMAAVTLWCVQQSTVVSRRHQRDLWDALHAAQHMVHHVGFSLYAFGVTYMAHTASSCDTVASLCGVRRKAPPLRPRLQDSDNRIAVGTLRKRGVVQHTGCRLPSPQSFLDVEHVAAQPSHKSFVARWCPCWRRDKRKWT